jgi:NHLM bacteriocin system ABC transporter ATP-binding protein
MPAQPGESNLVGQSHTLNGNESIILNDPQIVWIVKSGALTIFSTQTQAGVPEGARRYLFRVNAGQAMFSVLSAFSTASNPVGQIGQIGQPCQLLAVSLEETELLKISIDRFSTQLAQPDREAIGLVEGWIHQLDSVLASIIPPEIFERFPAACVPPQAIATTEPNQTAQEWIDNLAQLQGQLLQGIELLRQQEQHTEQLRLQARSALDQQMMDEVLAELTSVVLSQKTRPPTLPIGDDAAPLLIAAGAVGRALGIPIHPPAPSEDLSRMSDPLAAIARASHIRMRQIALQGHWWEKDAGPILTFTLVDNYPVALLPGSNSIYELFHPLEQTHTPVNEQIASNLALQAYTFYRPLPSHVNPLKLLQFALQRHLKELGTILITGIIASLLGMLIPQATAVLIDNAIPGANRGLLWQIALGLVAVAFGTTVFQLAQGFAIIRLQTFADSDTQAALWDRLLNLKSAFFRQYEIGDLSSRVGAIAQIHQTLSGTALRTIFSSFFALLNLGLLFYYNGTLALIALVIAFIYIVLTLISGWLTVSKLRPLLEKQGQLFGLMVQIINGVAKLRVAGAEVRAFAFWGKRYSTQLQLMLSTQGIEDMLTTIGEVLPACTNAIIFALAVSMLQQSQQEGGGFSIGTFLAFNAAFGSFIGGATSLSNSVVDVLEVVPLWQRSQPILQAEPETNSTKADPGRLSGSLKVDQLNFRYRADGALTLNNINIEAKPGEFIALVGPSGCGKSTLFRLLLGFELPESGSIYYDGQDLSGLDVQAVRRQMGVVLQNGRLMSASIFENIAGGGLVTQDEAWEAAQRAGFDLDIAAMPMGIHTVVSEGGTNLSGGQRQRLLIARALVLKPKILLFDEATSALDNRTQEIVSQSLEQLKVTRIAIAHRMSTIRKANRIYVLQNGRIVQQGSFEQLAYQEGLFAQLMLRQML